MMGLTLLALALYLLIGGYGLYQIVKSDRQLTQDCPVCEKEALRPQQQLYWKCRECGAIETTEELLERKDLR